MPTAPDIGQNSPAAANLMSMETLTRPPLIQFRHTDTDRLEQYFHSHSHKPDRLALMHINAAKRDYLKII